MASSHRRCDRSRCAVLTMCCTVALVLACIAIGPGTAPGLALFSGVSEQASFLQMSGSDETDGQLLIEPNNKEGLPTSKQHTPGQNQDNRMEARAMQKMETLEIALQDNGKVQTSATDSIGVVDQTEVEPESPKTEDVLPPDIDQQASTVSDPPGQSQSNKDPNPLDQEGSAEVDVPAQSDAGANPVDQLESTKAGSNEPAPEQAESGVNADAAPNPVDQEGPAEVDVPAQSDTAPNPVDQLESTESGSNEPAPEQAESEANADAAKQGTEQKRSTTSARALPMFYTYPTVTNVDLLCKPHKQCDDCQRVKPLLAHMLSKSTTGLNGTELFLVPLDPLALSRKKPYLYKQMLTRVLNKISHDKNYLRFGGSDHAFVCLSDGCQNVLKDITNSHPLGGNTRAMWIGRKEELGGVEQKWPCPNRVFAVPDRLLHGLGWDGKKGCRDVDEGAMVEGLGESLEMAASHTKGMNRWACSKDFWKMDMSVMKGKRHQGCMVIERHKLCIAGIPKCASSTMNILVRRMLGKSSWNDTHGHTHGARNGIKWVNPQRDFDRYNTIMTSTDWLNIAVVREPATRFLSAFVDKIVKKKEYGRVGYPKSMPKEPTLDWVVNRFMRMKEKGKMGDIDLHFRPMHYFASMGVIRYDFVARVGTLAEDIEAILKSVDLWEEYGASGWGEDGNLSFKEAKGRNVQKDGVQYYTEDLLRKVHHLYKLDYKLLGFSMAEEWGVEPS